MQYSALLIEMAGTSQNKSGHDTVGRLDVTKHIGRKTCPIDP
jgi:hypothetical protein